MTLKQFPHTIFRALALRLLDRALEKMAPEQAAHLAAEIDALAVRRVAEGGGELLRRRTREALRPLFGGMTSRDRLKTVRALVADAAEGMGDDDRRRLAPALVEQTIAAMPSESAFRAGAAVTDLVRLNPAFKDAAADTLAADWSGTVVVGPWLMEVGFELAYWIPFVRARLAALGVPPERVVAVSRGGAAPWYADIAGHYVDVLDVLTPQEFQEVTGTISGGDGNRKPFAAGPAERGVLQRALAAAGIDDEYRVLMPSAMYSLFRNVWRSRFGAHRFDELLAPALLPPAPQPPALPFDGPYVAVKLYHSLTFPDRPEIAAFATDLVRRLARSRPVVLLSNPGRLDDHDTLSFGGDATPFPVFDASTLYTPRDNLAVQTALVAGAEELHSTYGGFSYLGPLLGVDTIAYTDTYQFTFTHLDLMLTTLDRLDGAGTLAIMPVRRSPLADPAPTPADSFSAEC